MDQQDIMVDIETLDTRPSAAIVSIGACRIDWDNGVVTDNFYQAIRVSSNYAVGRSVSHDTMRWWDKQSEQARKVLTDPDAMDLDIALISFARYLGQFGLRRAASTVRLWGNGSDFDNVIIADAYSSLGLDAPWKFYNNRCFRTVKDLYSDVIQPPVREGVHHNALDDAVYQAKCLIQLGANLRGRRLR